MFINLGCKVPTRVSPPAGNLRMEMADAFRWWRERRVHKRFWVRGRTKWRWKAHVKTAPPGLWAFPSPPSLIWMWHVHSVMEERVFSNSRKQRMRKLPHLLLRITTPISIFPICFTFWKYAGFHGFVFFFFVSNRRVFFVGEYISWRCRPA